MTQLTFKVKGARITRRGLEDLGAAIPKIGRSRIRAMLDRVVKFMKVEPAERPGQTYIRTGRLSRGWKIQRIGAIGYKILNQAAFRGRRYAKYVVGSATGEKQARIHRGRWPLFRNVVDAEGAKLPRDVAKHIKLKARKLRFFA